MIIYEEITGFSNSNEDLTILLLAASIADSVDALDEGVLAVKEDSEAEDKHVMEVVDPDEVVVALEHVIADNDEDEDEDVDVVVGTYIFGN